MTVYIHNLFHHIETPILHTMTGSCLTIQPACNNVCLSVSAVPPTVTLPPSMLVHQGDPLTLDCQPTGNPPPSLSWFKNDQPLVASGDRLTISDDQRVVISNLYSTDEGNYSCVVSNIQGTAAASTFLTVLGEMSPLSTFLLTLSLTQFCHSVYAVIILEPFNNRLLLSLCL